MTTSSQCLVSTPAVIRNVRNPNTTPLAPIITVLAGPSSHTPAPPMPMMVSEIAQNRLG